MELSPLTLAQSHARNAQNAATPVAAIEEHDLAAAQFATAAKDTGNSEAFRTLKLLEQHHEKLSQLIKLQNSHPVVQASGTLPEQKHATQPPASPNTSKPRESSPYLSQQHNPLPAHLPSRDISSSIASNLASARGIPSSIQRRDRHTSSPLLPPNADGKVLSPPRRPKIGPPPKSAPEQRLLQTPVASIPQVFRTESPSPKPTPELPSPRNDEPFQRFYTTFETLISKISAPLAFAGLPLIPSSDSEPPIKPSPPQPKPPVPPSSDPSTAEIDYNKFFSRAALRALREEHGPKGGGGGFGTAAESFYVVPTTGGTISYADILARAQQEANLSKHHTASPSNPEDLRDDDEFVDARETPQPASPILTRTGARHHQNPPPGTKTMEELVLENSALRALADQFSKRLAEFEMGAQTSSLALHTSIRAMARSQSEGAAGMAGAGDERAKRLGEERVMRLEEEAGGLRKEAERLGRENEKLRGVVGRYRERWEKLKEGARGRREGGEGGRGEEG